MASASGTKKSGDSVLTSEDVDHQQTTNRTHEGDTITPEALEATDATVANRDVGEYLYDLQIGLGEARFEQGLSKLGYDGGWFDVLEDESLVASKTDVEGFTGSVTTISSVDYGQFSSPFQTLNFVPSSVVVGHDADERGSVVADNGEQFEYEVANASSVDNAELSLTGETTSKNKTKSYSELANESVSIDIGGNIDPVGHSSDHPTVVFEGVRGDSNESVSDRYDDTYMEGGDTLTMSTPIDLAANHSDTVTVSVDSKDMADFEFGSRVYNRYYGDVTINANGGGQSKNIGDVKGVESHEISITDSTTSIEVTGTADGNWDGQHSSDVDMTSEWQTYGPGPSVDPSIDIDGDGSIDASYNGTLDHTDDPVSYNLTNLSHTTDTINISIESGVVDVKLKYAERTKTQNPDIMINSEDGSQKIEYAGFLSDGSSVDLSNEIDESLIGGSVTVSVTVSDTVTSPVGQVDLEYRHEGFDAGGLIKYTIEDSDGNVVTAEDDKQVDVSFTSSDVKITPIVQDGLATAELYDYAVYFQ